MRLDLPNHLKLKDDEIVVDVRAAGVGNWDEIIRTGGWDVALRPPMALGVEASGVVSAVGSTVRRFAVGDAVLTHSVPLRHQGAWAEQYVAAESAAAKKPPGMSWEVAAAFPVPGLTAYQTLAQLRVGSGETVLVHGGAGVTGGLIVAFAAGLGARVVATASAANAARLKAAGADLVIDYRTESWYPELRAALGAGAAVVINAVRGAASTLLSLVADNGRFATITSDPPRSERGIQVLSFYVAPDGETLARAAVEFSRRHLTLHIATAYALVGAGAALAAVVSGKSGGAVVIEPNRRQPRMT